MIAPEDGPEIRAILGTLTEDNKALEAEIRDRTWPLVLSDAGYDPESGEAKAIVKTYKGDLEPTAVAEYAREEFGFEPTPAVSEEEAIRDQLIQARSEGEARTAALHAGALSVRDPSPKDKIAKAEAEGDWKAAGRLQAQMLMNGSR